LSEVHEVANGVEVALAKKVLICKELELVLVEFACEEPR
jgi:hypothetical protein